MTTRSPSRMGALQHERRRSFNSSDEGLSQPVHQSAALRGASRAFVKAPVKPGTQTNTYSGINRATAAATVVSTRGNSPAGNKPFAQPSENRGGAGPGDAPLFAAQQSFVRGQVVKGVAKSSSSNSLRVPGDESSRNSASPSYIAATLAAARFTLQNTDNTLLRPSRSRKGTSSSPMNIEEHHGILPSTGSVRVAKKHFMQLYQGSGGASTMVPGSAPTVNKEYPTDATSIAPAVSLIGLFEHNQSNIDPLKVDGRPLKSIGTAPIIQSPRPIRPPSRSTPPTAAILAAQKSTPFKKEGEALGPHVAEKSHRPAVAYKCSSEPDTPPVSPSRHMHPINTKAATLTNRDTILGSPEGSLKLPVGIIPPRLRTRGVPSRPPPLKMTQKPDAPPASLRKASPALEIESEDFSSVASCVFAPDIGKKPAVPPPRRRRSQHTNAPTSSPLLSQYLDRVPLATTQERAIPLAGDSLTCPMTQPYPGTPYWLDGLHASSSGEGWIRPPSRRMTPHLTGEPLANAVTASSLASSRAPSPSKSPAPPPLPKRHHHLLHQRGHQNSRTPSPTRGMRHTMRKPPKSDDESQGMSATHRGGRRNLIKKAPNKHHEGDRRRWRDEITDRERKRYEGVWAANKGLHIFITKEGFRSLESPAEGDWREDVSNLVVKDIWSRSRLEVTALEEIWDLVDRRGIGRLTREEFVVGMWLIDQRLKGRKLPVKISASVWGSVRKLGGVMVARHKV